MVLKNLNDVSIYIAPLCNDNITLEDLTVEAGFINAFTSDKNRPYFEDKIFLVYDSSVNTEQSTNRLMKFKQLDTIHSKRQMLIKGKQYTVYCFCNPKHAKDIQRLKINGKTFSIDTRRYLIIFWKDVSIPELTLRLLSDSYRFGDSITAEIPEEDDYDDYIPKRKLRI